MSHPKAPGIAKSECEIAIRNRMVETAAWAADGIPKSDGRIA